MIRHPSRILSAEEIGNVTLNRLWVYLYRVNSGSTILEGAMGRDQRRWDYCLFFLALEEDRYGTKWLRWRCNVTDIERRIRYEGFKKMIESYQGRIKKNRKNSCTILESLSVVLFKQASLHKSASVRLSCVRNWLRGRYTLEDTYGIGS